MREITKRQSLSKAQHLAGGSYLRAGFAVSLGILFLGESFTWSIAAGMALIIIGVIAVTVPLRRPR